MQLVGRQRWLDSGAPIRCAYCQERFDGEAHHSADGRYFCSLVCEESAIERQTPEQRLRLVQWS